MSTDVKLVSFKDKLPLEVYNLQDHSEGTPTVR